MRENGRFNNKRIIEKTCQQKINRNVFFIIILFLLIVLPLVAAAVYFIHVNNKSLSSTSKQCYLFNLKNRSN